MRLQRIQELIIIAGVVGIVGTVCALIGSAYVFTSGLAIGADKLKIFKSKPEMIVELFHTGGLFLGGGLILMGGTMAVCDKLNDLECDQLMAELENDERNLKEITIPDDCKKCKYFHCSKYLPCAVNPELKVECGDWEPKL